MPCAHCRHTVEPVPGAYLPGMHHEQLVLEPGVPRYAPGWHAIHTVAPEVSVYMPATHDAHAATWVEAPVTLPYIPAGQLVDDPSPLQYLPGGHCVHVPERHVDWLEFAAVPLGHGVQLSGQPVL